MGSVNRADRISLPMAYDLGNKNRCKSESVGRASAFEGMGNETGISAALRIDAGAISLPRRKKVWMPLNLVPRVM
ncbi:hypothetical protein CU560_06395 [Serratia ureilytica]|nr:hypothetical protein CU560_06395 [Serratia ureilytica]